VNQKDESPMRRTSLFVSSIAVALAMPACAAETPDDDEFDYEFIEDGADAPIEPWITTNPPSEDPAALGLKLGADGIRLTSDGQMPDGLRGVELVFGIIAVEKCPAGSDDKCSGQWQLFNEGAMTVQLFEPKQDPPLGVTALTPGHYDDVRVVFTEAFVEVEEGRYPVAVDVHGEVFEAATRLESGMRTDLTLSLEADLRKDDAGWSITPRLQVTAESISPIDATEP
jgi:hypothetical protein